MITWALGFTLALSAAPLQPAGYPPGGLLDFPAKGDTARLILIGDTGEPSALTAQWGRSIRALTAKGKANPDAAIDGIVVLGDLVYPQAPACPRGRAIGPALRMLDSHIGGTVGGLGAPTFLVIGNHDVTWREGERPRRPCVIDYAAKTEGLYMPSMVYAVDFGVAILVVVDTLALDDATAQWAKTVFASHADKVPLMAGHHVVKTYQDKITQDVVLPWLKEHDLKPALFANGHAHLMQFGHYDGVWAVTSGTAAKPRPRPECRTIAGKEGDGECGAGQLFGTSTPGYAILEVQRGGALSLVFKDADNQDLWRWESPR